VILGNEVSVIGIPGRHPDVASVYAAGAAGAEDLRRAATEGPRVPLSSVELIRPVLGDVAVVCVGLNYRGHIEELGYEIPTAPTLFSKLARALADPGADIEVPEAPGQLDYEGEFAVVIGTGGRRIAEADAWEHVGGVTLMNDVSMRDYQRRSSQWFAGKSWQRSTPIGPVVVTPDELRDAVLTVRVNGELRQTAALDDLVFDIPRLIADISTIIELRPGDIIATGTPGGVGLSLDPPIFLAPGDLVEVECPAIGLLSNRVRAGAA
jgi:acylpyruvate hydrolase